MCQKSKQDVNLHKIDKHKTFHRLKGMSLKTLLCHEETDLKGSIDRWYHYSKFRTFSCYFFPQLWTLSLIEQCGLFVDFSYSWSVTLSLLFLTSLHSPCRVYCSRDTRGERQWKQGWRQHGWEISAWNVQLRHRSWKLLRIQWSRQ